MKGMARAMSVEQFVGRNAGTCPQCMEGFLSLRESRVGKNFFGCSRYPVCDYATNARRAGPSLIGATKPDRHGNPESIWERDDEEDDGYNEEDGWLDFGAGWSSEDF